jgi:tRNA(Ile)-lysidine synthase
VTVLTVQIKELQERVASLIKGHDLMQPGMKVLVGVSGGADSVALLHIIKELAPRLQVNVLAVHLDHLLRDEAGEDAAFVQVLARGWDIPVFVGYARVDVLARRWKIGVEEAGRRCRYALFHQLCLQTGASRIAVAHQADDQAETILLNLLRGSGPAGLAGMQPRSGVLIRPLLELTRDETEGYCRSLGINWRDDPSNRSADFLRNRVRHQLLPYLEKEYNPRIKENLQRLGKILGAEESYWDHFIWKYFYRVCRERVPGQVKLELAAWQNAPRVLQRRLLRTAIKAASGEARDIGYNHIEDCLAFLDRNSGRGEVQLPHGVRVLLRRDTLIVAGSPTPAPVIAKPVCRKLQIPGETILPELGISLQADLRERLPGVPVKADLPAHRFQACFDYDKIETPLYVRRRCPGDRLRPFGLEGSKKLKKLLGDLKVPAEDRDEVALVASQRDIYWVAGYRRSVLAPITEETREILTLTARKKLNYNNKT